MAILHLHISWLLTRPAILLFRSLGTALWLTPISWKLYVQPSDSCTGTRPHWWYLSSLQHSILPAGFAGPHPSKSRKDQSKP
ncbi:hypothetical protein F5883DRAFT_565635 [Diaporthe sp. PMI_573]|nr:hypothetical protein F5883DRAFT_565635 [Diaporthaceae sp. PMI_573]